MTRWEYLVEHLRREGGPINQQVELLDERGADGWELVGFDPCSPLLMIFKRPKVRADHEATESQG